MSRRSFSAAVFTCRRPLALERCLVHLLGQPDCPDPIAVYDDSRPGSAAARNLAVIDRLARRFRRSIEYVGRDIRRQLADSLARDTGVAEAVARFALLGARGATTTIGASRNAMLLTLAGARVICCDDDVVPRVAAIPFQKPGAVWLGSTPPSPRGTFYASHQEAIDQIEWLDRTVAGLHAPLLGRSIRTIVQQHSRTGQVERAPLAAGVTREIESGDARVIVSTTGVVGDNYSVSPRWNPARDDGALRLVAPAARYRAATVTNHLVEGMAGLILSRPSRTPFFHVGLDVTEIVPPFLPVARREDNLFMTMLGLCRPDAWHAISPFVVEHARVDGKQAARAQVWRDMGTVSVADLLWHLLSLAAPLPPTGAVAATPATALPLLGRIIGGAASGTRGQFRDQMVAAGRQIMARRAQFLDQLLERHDARPRYWAIDLERQIAELLRQSVRAARCLPFDLLPAGLRTERETALHDTLRLYGELLCAWPQLFAAAVRRR